MQRVILVVSPDSEFVGQIRSHLEEGGRFQVTGATSAHEALTLANSNFYEVAILDGEVEDIPLAPFSRDLAALQSELKILVFPPENNPQHPSLAGLSTNGYLSKPFSGPEIGRALSNLFSDQPVDHDDKTKLIDDLIKQWLQHPETGEEKANQILKATSAEVSLIIVKGQQIAGAGAINGVITGNVMSFLSRYWKDDENSEVARFLRFDGDNQDKLLYAIKLVSSLILVLIYPNTVTLQQVRRELRVVKENFQKNYPSTSELRQEIAERALADIQERNKTLEAMQPFTGAISQSELDLLRQMQEEQKAGSTSPAISEEELNNLNKMIESLPTPDPNADLEVETSPQPLPAERKLPEWLNELEQTAEESQNNEKSDIGSPIREEKNPLNTPPFVNIGSLTNSQPIEESTAANFFQDTSVVQNPPNLEALPEIDVQFPWEMEDSGADDTIAIKKKPEVAGADSFSEALQAAIKEPERPSTTEAPPPAIAELMEKAAAGISPSIPAASVGEPLAANEPFPSGAGSLPTLKDFRFNYTCLLVPEGHNQFLARELSEKLSLVLPQFHQAQGWQLTSITIRPQYLLWTVSVAMNVSPQQIIHDIRGLTSAHIFANFPDIAKNKTSDDFWSSKYLAVSGSEPPSVNLIQEFVSQTWKNPIARVP